MSKAAIDTLEKVSAEFESEVVLDLQEGRAEAAGRLESARKETAEMVAKVLETSVKQAESLKRQIVGAAELEARNSQLRSLEVAVNEVFEMSVKEIGDSDAQAYERSMTHLIQEGLEVIGPRTKVYCSAKDKKAVSAAVKKLSTGQVKLTLEDAHIETVGGVVLSTHDDSIKFDNTFEARLARSKAELRKEVAGILTGQV